MPHKSNFLYKEKSYVKMRMYKNTSHSTIVPLIIHRHNNKMKQRSG